MTGGLKEHIECVQGILRSRAPEETGCQETEELLRNGHTEDTHCHCCSVNLADYPEYLKKLVRDQQQLLEDLWN